MQGLRAREEPSRTNGRKSNNQRELVKMKLAMKKFTRAGYCWEKERGEAAMREAQTRVQASPGEGGRVGKQELFLYGSLVATVGSPEHGAAMVAPRLWYRLCSAVRAQPQLKRADPQGSGLSGSS